MLSDRGGEKSLSRKAGREIFSLFTRHTTNMGEGSGDKAKEGNVAKKSEEKKRFAKSGHRDRT